MRNLLRDRQDVVMLNDSSQVRDAELGAVYLHLKDILVGALRTVGQMILYQFRDFATYDRFVEASSVLFHTYLAFLKHKSVERLHHGLPLRIGVIELL